MEAANFEGVIQPEIERLRQEFPNTQELYREACALLFFRHGITPTANKLYQYVRKGSMNAPAEALGRFWEDLREKSRVRIEAPDLPENLREGAGELVISLWSQAQETARNNLEGLRKEAAESVRVDAEARRLAEEETRDALLRLQAARQDRDHCTQRIRALEEELAAERAGRSALEARHSDSQSELARLLEAFAELRREHAEDLRDRLAAAQAQDEERHAAFLEKAQVDLERERAVVERLQGEVESVRSAAAAAEERARAEARDLQQELGQARQQVGSLEGSARELQAARSELAAELAATRTRCTEAIAGLAAAARDAGHAIARGKELEADVAALRANLASLAQQPAHHGVSEKNQKRIRRIVPSESEKLDFAPR